MFEKMLVFIILGLMIIGALFLESNTYLAAILLWLATLISFSHYYHLRRLIGSRFSFLSRDKCRSSKQLLIATAAKMLDQQHVAKLVIQEIEKIGDSQSTHLSTAIDPLTAAALTRLKEKLDAYRKEEAKQKWVVEGIAYLSELRKSVHGVDDFGNQVIAYLVKYLGANQGAFYILQGEEDAQVLELTACYAYGKRKHYDEKITISAGNGMLGQCVQDKEMIFLKDVPKDFVRITSGLGEGTPTCVLIAPLIFGDRVYGAIEVASFQILEDYQLDFSRKLCTNIAVELSAMMIYENTERLLEQTIQSQELMKQKEQQISAKLLEVEAERGKNIAILNACMDGVLSFDEQGTIGFANAAAEEIFNRRQHQLLGSDVRDLIGITLVRNRQGENILLSSSGSEITVRTEVNTKDNELSLLLTAAKVEMNEGHLFTLFIQKISVELF